MESNSEHTIVINISMTVEEACALQKALRLIVVPNKKAIPGIFAKLLDAINEQEVSSEL